MKISVVMATYNGGRYVTKQLQSIADQTRKPDEVIIFDDASTDNTQYTINEFIEQNGLSGSWQLHVQDRNVGWKKNFFSGNKAATGDVVFFSDQDDIWHSDKIAKMSEIMESQNAGCIYGDYEFIDEEDRPVSGANDRRRVAEIKDEKLFNTIVTMGCRMCISREVADIFVAMDAPDFAYDSQCGRLAYLYSDLVIIPDVVLKYRIHGTNTSGIGKDLEEGSLTLEARISEIEDNIDWLNKLMVFDKTKKNGANSDLIEDILTFQKNRLGYLKGNIGASKIDRQYYRDWAMMIGDIAYRHGVNRLLGNAKRLLTGGGG